MRKTGTDMIEQVLRRKVSFVTTFFVVFGLSFGVLYLLDFYPELVIEKTEPVAVEITGSSDAESTVSGTADVVVGKDGEGELEATVPEGVSLGLRETDVDPMPRVIHIPKLDRTVAVYNPSSRKVADLDEALLDGVVRHPDSATFTNEGNIFILGHSSYLPNVLNRNFQAFNGIKDLTWGDTIIIRSEDTEYLYRVDKVYHAKANELTVPIAGTGPKLTLATCNSFGTTDDRYIVEATMMRQSAL